MGKGGLSNFPCLGCMNTKYIPNLSLITCSSYSRDYVLYVCRINLTAIHFVAESSLQTPWYKKKRVCCREGKHAYSARAHSSDQSFKIRIKHPIPQNPSITTYSVAVTL